MRSTAVPAAVVVAMSVAASAQSALVYGGGTEITDRYNPGSGAIVYMNCFTLVSGPSQRQLDLESVAVGIRREATNGALTDVGVNIYAAEMTATFVDGFWQFGRGENTLLYSTPSLGGGTESITQLVSTGPIPSVVLDLETGFVDGLGGWWIGLEFTGPGNGALSPNGWRIVGEPTTGGSINGFGGFNINGSGVFDAFLAFGSPPGSAPSRFLVNVEGNLVPTPGALALIGLAGLSSRRRR